MQTLEIDGSHFSTLEGFYDEVSSALIPGKLWGHNLDAFSDILRGGFGTPQSGFRLVWRNADKSRTDLGYLETAKQLAIRLEECHPTNRPSVAAELASAQALRGATVFDWLVEIIESHETIHLVLA